MSTGSTGPTPGPWEYEVHELSEGYSAIVYGLDGRRIGTDHLSEADAALIAAAPNLLEAAQAVVAQWETPNWKLTEPTAVFIANLRAAILKATGHE